MTNGDGKNAPNSNTPPPRLSDEAANGAEGEDVFEAPGGDLTEMDVLRNEAAKAKNDLLYARAEFENFKKQTIKERSDMRKFGSERLLVEMLSVLDILETALAAEWTPDSHETFRKGIELTAQELRAAMQRHGVQEAPAQGVNFDPTLHEALSSEESEQSPGTITRVFKKPYRLHDRLIRAGQVVVAKPKL